MNLLSSEQWQRLDEIIFEIHALTDLATLTDYVLHRLPEYLGCHFASWSEHNSQLYLTSVRNSNSHQKEVEKMLPVLLKVLPDHPVFPLFMDFETGRVRFVHTVERLRSHTSGARYHESIYYQELASHFQIEDQLLMHVMMRDLRGVVLTFHSQSVISDTIYLHACVLRGHLLARLHSLECGEISSGQDAERILEHLHDSLTGREYEVLRWLCTGKSNDEIGTVLGISKRTVDKHVENLLRRLDEESRGRIIARYGSVVTNSSSA